MEMEVVICTRDSALAMWQANWVLDKLRARFPKNAFRLMPVKTKGDKILDVALAKIGDKGLFTKELEVALLEGQAHVAVHSMKDLPTKLPQGLCIGAICQREDPMDVIISPKGWTLQDLPHGARVGTSSLRRRAQLLHYRPDLNLLDLRGNLHTRMVKLDRGDYDAIILARAGVVRLGMTERITGIIPYAVCLPAVGQGSIGIEIRNDDHQTASLVKVLNDPKAEQSIRAERAFLRELEGGCQVPIGALGSVEKDGLILEGMVANLEGTTIIREKMVGMIGEPEILGQRLAKRLIELGATDILSKIRREFEQC